LSEQRNESPSDRTNAN